MVDGERNKDLETAANLYLHVYNELKKVTRVTMERPKRTRYAVENDLGYSGVIQPICGVSPFTSDGIELLVTPLDSPHHKRFSLFGYSADTYGQQIALQLLGEDPNTLNLSRFGKIVQIAYEENDGKQSKPLHVSVWGQLLPNSQLEGIFEVYDIESTLTPEQKAAMVSEMLIMTSHFLQTGFRQSKDMKKFAEEKSFLQRALNAISYYTINPF